ncbi:hypothetical protein [Colwellia sp. PAMC 21821]|uniref:hypothetical protein n=1 Tax=Colwellia sp. PAMC 21821 TaxID=1816219 RepID=UPI0009C0300D|nr:hypothetical protein [Colwellia sp. PAMC 21821]ARD45112.1 hypothetical protein A3Q33_12805 [Colwellia sp. PAMC 21821]
MATKQDDVFNLSVTELLLIIMFSLLVVMVLLNSTLSEEIEKKREASKEYTELANELEKINTQLGLKDPVKKEINLELNEAVAQMRSLVQALKKSVESDAAEQVLAKMKLNDVWTTLSRIKEDNLDIPELIKALTKLNKELEDCLSKNTELSEKLDNVSDRFRNLEAIEKELTDTKKQLKKALVDNKNLTGQVANLSNGLEFPPCWATEEGKAQYTYRVTVYDDSLHVNTIYPSSREESYISLMGKSSLDKRFSLQEFKIQFGVFYTKAVNSVPECRFFVQVYDATSPNSKDEWKEGLNTIESIFYKYEVK